MSVIRRTVLPSWMAPREVKCEWRTEDNTAKASTHYMAGKGVLEFEHGQMVTTIPLTVLPAGRCQLRSSVRIVIFNITGAKFDPNTEGGKESCVANVVIEPDPDIQEMAVDQQQAFSLMSG
eukprot:Skav214701  [mRNA]  locus=scaffold331:3591:8690:+ [translate_table: standard]